MNLSEIMEQKLKAEAKEVVKDFLSKGRTLNNVTRFTEVLKEEVAYQLEHNTIVGLSNGKVV
ncbi:hypothetical protein A2Z56_02570 [Candidatus Kaiserbacteria bacterium RIFCSPHIGHO2_12_45_16]|nr:MAG: hypothetical protein A2Z56_02570 [Candidatus Kaiserbacteria bacterium RIFCSPHIGHO2_12_45_16]